MPFDLAQLKAELATLPTTLPYATELAIAVVNDCFRMANRPPVPLTTWQAWRAARPDPWLDQLSLLAEVLATTSLRAQTVRQPLTAPAAEAVLESFFASLGPLDTTIVRSNAFRQEELLRKFAEESGEDAKLQKGLFAKIKDKFS